MQSIIISTCNQYKTIIEIFYILSFFTKSWKLSSKLTDSTGKKEQETHVHPGTLLLRDSESKTSNGIRSVSLLHRMTLKQKGPDDMQHEWQDTMLLSTNSTPLLSSSMACSWTLWGKGRGVGRQAESLMLTRMREADEKLPHDSLPQNREVSEEWSCLKSS